MLDFLRGFGKRKKKDRPYLAAVIAAAGQSARMGEDKLLIELLGLPVLVHTLMAFEQCPAVDEIIVVTSEKNMVEVSRLCRAFEFAKVSKVIKGGDTRQQSVLNGLLEVSKEADFAAIHDGARPLVTPERISEIAEAAFACGAAAPGVTPKETVKLVRQGVIEKTVDRDSLVLIQTPQVFDIDLIKGALSRAEKAGQIVTDDCSAVELAGGTVRVCPGDYDNIKLTTPEDIAAAEAILAGRSYGK